MLHQAPAGRETARDTSRAALERFPGPLSANTARSKVAAAATLRFSGAHALLFWKLHIADRVAGILKGA